jgi:RNA polymerase sigma factor (sigma-70 family)
LRNHRPSQEKLYRKYYPALFLLCKRFFADDHQAMGVLNDGMLKVYRNLSKYEGSKGELFNWIYTIIRNEALTAIRSARLIPVVEFTEEVSIPAVANLWDTMEWKETYKLLDMLTPATRIVAAMFYLEGYSVKEIADATMCSTGTVKWHLSESRRKLKPVFEKFYQPKQRM